MWKKFKTRKMLKTREMLKTRKTCPPEESAAKIQPPIKNHKNYHILPAKITRPASAHFETNKTRPVQSTRPPKTLPNTAPKPHPTASSPHPKNEAGPAIHLPAEPAPSHLSRTRPKTRVLPPQSISNIYNSTILHFDTPISKSPFQSPHPQKTI